MATEAGDLQPGVKGLRTLALQQKLNDLRFDVGKPDGSFGQMTVMAVWAWQAAHGQPANGVVTPVQYVQIMGSGPLAMLHPEAGPDHVEVDLDRQILLEFRSGQLDLVTHVSTGSGRAYCERDPRNGQRNCGDAQTPPGLFAFGRRASGWEIGPLGGLYNPVYFNRGIAVHGAPSVPNRPASHGCVRIPMHIAEYFPGRVTTGEPVLVFHGGLGPLATATNTPPPPTAPPATTSPITTAPPTSAPTVTTPASTAPAPATSVAPPVSFGSMPRLGTFVR